MAQSTKSRPVFQGVEVPEDFPLTAHRNGQWVKKRHGKTYYFGKMAAGWQAAFAEYQREWPYILEHGCRRPAQIPTPTTTPDQLTVKGLCNAFLNAKLQAVDTGELSGRSFLDYRVTSERIMAAFGKERIVADLRPEDFQTLRNQLATGRSPVTLGNEIQRCRVLFKFAYDQELIDRPVRYGQGFKKPSQKTLRLKRRENADKHGKRKFEAAEIRLLVEQATQPLKPMILLAINCGFGQTDLANLKEKDIDLERGFIDFPRPKTGVDRRIPLWPETVVALREWRPQNPKAKVPEAEGLAFVTKYGNKWVKVSELAVVKHEDGTASQSGGSPDDAIGKEFAKLLRTTGIKPKGERKGLNFYAIRHTFETIGGGSLDQVAVNHIMGHVDNSMAAVYREGIPDERLIKVTEHVRQWAGFPIPAK